MFSNSRVSRKAAIFSRCIPLDRGFYSNLLLWNKPIRKWNTNHIDRQFKSDSFMKGTNQNPLVANLISELGRSLELVMTLPNHVYCSPDDGAGSIGTHIRHNLDHVTSLLGGVKTGSVDYANRSRDRRTETDQKYAAENIQAVIERVRAIAVRDLSRLLSVRSESRSDFHHRSSFSRELEYVYSHTVHHHALINERLRHLGMKQVEGLGVAPSTKEYWGLLKLAA